MLKPPIIRKYKSNQSCHTLHISDRTQLEIGIMLPGRSRHGSPMWAPICQYVVKFGTKGSHDPNLSSLGLEQINSS